MMKLGTEMFFFRALGRGHCFLLSVQVPKELFMNLAIKIAALAAVAALTGCTDLKPLQAQVDDLKSQVSKLSSDVAANKTSTDAAARAAATAGQSATQANTTAGAAQNTANQALAAAKAAQAGVDATNEKIDRMFKRSVSK